jgi:phosphoribosylanthranilate isomerase
VTANPFNSKRFFIKHSDHVRVKICGVRKEADAIAAVECGADALGFNLYAGSKRYIQWQKEAAWIRELPAEISRIAVIVNSTLEEARHWLEMDLFDGLQLHGEESREFCESLVKCCKPVLKSVRLTNVGLLEQVRAYPVFGILIDSYRKGSFGGTGERFDWTLLRGIELEKPLIVAGGLTPENVADAVRQMRPYAVDVATGVENREGFKDRFKMRDFVVAARVQDQASKEQKNFDGTRDRSKARQERLNRRAQGSPRERSRE